MGGCTACRPAPIDQGLDDQSIICQARLSAQLRSHHAIEGVATPRLFSRSGTDRLHDADGPDPLSAQRDVKQLVTGLEHVYRSPDARVENRSFGKYYALPTPEEVFGNGVLVLDNLALLPERSHNANLGVAIERVDPGRGDFTLDMLGTLRRVEDQILLLGNDRSMTHHNVFGARALGVEGTTSWESAGEWLVVDTNTSWIDFRNTSTEGAFGDFAGDRIPNRPRLMVNGHVALQRQPVVLDADQLRVDWTTRYVHGFYRSWESIGLADSKQAIDAMPTYTTSSAYRGPAGRGLDSSPWRAILRPADVSLAE